MLFSLISLWLILQLSKASYNLLMQVCTNLKLVRSGVSAYRNIHFLIVLNKCYWCKIAWLHLNWIKIFHSLNTILEKLNQLGNCWGSEQKTALIMKKTVSKKSPILIRSPRLYNWLASLYICCTCRPTSLTQPVESRGFNLTEQTNYSFWAAAHSSASLEQMCSLFCSVCKDEGEHSPQLIRCLLPCGT